MGKSRGQGEGEMGRPERAHTHLKPVGDDPDWAWTFEEPGQYDREKFYVKSSDGKGHHGNPYLPMQPEMMARINELVASKLIPHYRTPQDMMRNAIYHQLRYDALRIKDGRLLQYLDSEMIAARNEMAMDQMARGKKNVDTTVARFDECISLQWWDGLEEALDELEGTLNDGGISEPFVGQMWNLVEKYRARWKDKR